MDLPANERTTLQPQETTLPSQWLVLVLLCAFTSVFTLLHLNHYIIDDAYISFRYAWNFAHGNGLTFNIGERTEGYSNLLWTLLVAVSYWIETPITVFAFAFGAVFTALAVFLSALSALALGARFWIAALLSSVLALSPLFWSMNTFGLEGGMASFALALFLFLGARHKEFSVAVLGAASFCIRPELLVWYPIYIVVRLACERSGLRSALRQLTGPTGVWLTIIFCITAWRYSYYGDFLPNTLRAKSVDFKWDILSENFRLGINYIAGFLLSIPMLSLGFVGGTIVGVIRRQPIILTGVLLLLFEFFVVIVNGGDWIWGYRFLTVFSPVLTIVSAWLIEICLRTRLVSRMAQAAIAVCAVGALVSVVSSISTGGALGVAWRPTITTDLSPSGDGCYPPVVSRLAPVMGGNDKISLDALGFASYNLIHVYAYDMWGLTDRYTAVTGTYGRQMGRLNPHHDYFDVRPNVVLAHGGTMQFHLLQVASSGAFESTYDSYELKNIPSCSGRFFIAYLKADRKRFEPLIADFKPVPVDLN